VYTKCTSGTQVQKDAWHQYSLATFLLGSNGRSWFRFGMSQPESDPTSMHPWWRVPIGSPTNAYAKIGGVYQRWFTNGRVLVNPTTGTFTVQLGRRYRTLDGKTVTSVQLGAWGAAVLTKP
jgi:hypothetical protein